MKHDEAIIDAMRARRVRGLYTLRVGRLGSRFSSDGQQRRIGAGSGVWDAGVLNLDPSEWQAGAPCAIRCVQVPFGLKHRPAPICLWRIRFRLWMPVSACWRSVNAG
jgi:hypothetical protein